MSVENPGIAREAAVETSQGQTLMKIGDDINAAVGGLKDLPSDKQKVAQDTLLAMYMEFADLAGRAKKNVASLDNEIGDLRARLDSYLAQLRS